MEYIAGKKITDLNPLSLIDLNRKELAEELFHAYLKQILVDGFFHADPHPGNLYITDSGDRSARYGNDRADHERI